MYTIKQAARLTGVPEASLRAWERRYGVVVPHRNPSGYRVYDDAALAALSDMRRLVDEGWSPAQAAAAVLDGTVPAATVDERTVRTERTGRDSAVVDPSSTNAATDLFLTSAIQLDSAGIEESLDAGFALGSFEHVADTWLFPALAALGDGWSRGEIDVAGEHAASAAVYRRLSAAYDAAGSRSRGPRVVVGLPPGGQHDLGALAFATALRRRGLDVLYLGADVPVDSWEIAVRGRQAHAAVLSVPMPEDRSAAAEVAERLLAQVPTPIVCAGGTSGADISPGVRSLPFSITQASEELDQVVHESD